MCMCVCQAGEAVCVCVCVCVCQADEAVCIGPAPVHLSYLRSDHVLDAARRTQSSAVHPGYGLLSENADFAAACSQAHLTFVGPPPSAIRDMGVKR